MVWGSNLKLSVISKDVLGYNITLMGGLPRIEVSMHHHVENSEHLHKDGVHSVSGEATGAETKEPGPHVSC